MELNKVEKMCLPDGNTYTGWGYVDDNTGDFIPNGCGKKYYQGYYTYGNFRNGMLNGPAINSHDYCMTTCFFKNNRGNGWGVSLNRGELTEFGYYVNSQLKNDLSDFVAWYFAKMEDSDRRNENMLHVYTHKETKEVVELLIGFTGSRPENGIALCYMGFRFKADGSVWVGTTCERQLNGTLIHFRPDGLIDAGEFRNGELINRKSLQAIIDDYYGTWKFDGKFEKGWGNVGHTSPFQTEREQRREEFRNIQEIEEGRNYFQTSVQSISNSINSYSMTYHVCEVSFDNGNNFHDLGFDAETWKFGTETIETEHGNFSVEDAIFVDNGPLVGIQFQVEGSMHLSDFDDYDGFDDNASIKILALMRQPQNVWLWVYAFDEYDNQVAIFCGRDDLDGLSHYVNVMRRLYK